jgi:hypothetical protein
MKCAISSWSCMDMSGHPLQPPKSGVLIFQVEILIFMFRVSMENVPCPFEILPS